MQIIDIHPHIISDDIIKYPITPLGNKRSDWSAERGSNTAEKLLESMEDAGVNKAIVVHSTTTYGYNCEYVADSAAKYPGRLWGIGCVDFLADDAVEKLDYWTNKRGLIGIRLFTGGGKNAAPADWIIDPRTDKCWKWAQETKTPIVMQLRGPSLGFLRQLMDKYEGLTLLLDHSSSPSLEDGYPYQDLQPVFNLVDYPGLYLKVTTVNLRKAAKGNSNPQDFLRALKEVYGAKRICWCSNFPSSDGTLKEHVELALAASSEFTEEEQALFMGGNAARIYGV